MMREMPDEEKPREKISGRGVNTLTNNELLTVLIGTGTQKISATVLATQILAMDSSGIAYLAECTLEDLEKIKGIGIAKACQILSAVELGKRIAARPKEKRVNISAPHLIAKIFMEEMRYLKKEVFKTLLLNVKNEIIAIDEVAKGDLNSTVVHPREVFINAIKKSAASIIFIHNHPSGNPSPSREDIELTNRLIDAAKILGIAVLDHIIIGDGIYTSLKEKFLI